MCVFLVRYYINTVWEASNGTRFHSKVRAFANNILKELRRVFFVMTKRSRVTVSIMPETCVEEFAHICLRSGEEKHGIMSSFLAQGCS